MRRLLLGVVLLFAACAREARDGLPPSPWSRPPDLGVDLRAWQSADEVPLLSPWTVVVDLFVGPGVECDFVPAVPDGFRGTVDSGEFTPLGAGRQRRFTLALRPVQLGELTVAPMRAEGRRTSDQGDGAPIVATTPQLQVRVTSLLEGHGEELEAPAPPFAPRFPWQGVALGALAVVLLALGFLWWRRRPKRTRQAPAETPLPAHVRALRALARLRGASRATPEEIDAFYVEVSRVLRVYLEERFGLHAPERTTEEFLAEIHAQGAASPLDGAQRNALSAFLRQCDLVKFARVLPGEDAHAETLRTAEQLVEATRVDRVLQEVGS